MLRSDNRLYASHNTTSHSMMIEGLRRRLHFGVSLKIISTLRCFRIIDESIDSACSACVLCRLYILHPVKMSCRRRGEAKDVYPPGMGDLSKCGVIGKEDEILKCTQVSKRVISRKRKHRSRRRRMVAEQRGDLHRGANLIQRLCTELCVRLNK